jgi:hypothetical protein
MDLPDPYRPMVAVLKKEKAICKHCKYSRRGDSLVSYARVCQAVTETLYDKLLHPGFVGARGRPKADGPVLAELENPDGLCSKYTPSSSTLILRKIGLRKPIQIYVMDLETAGYPPETNSSSTPADMSLFEMKNERWDMNQYEVLKRTMAEASSTLDKLQPTRSGALLNYEVIQKLLNNLQEEVQQLEADLDEEDPWDV